MTLILPRYHTGRALPRRVTTSDQGHQDRHERVCSHHVSCWSRTSGWTVRTRPRGPGFVWNPFPPSITGSPRWYCRKFPDGHWGREVDGVRLKEDGHSLVRGMRPVMKVRVVWTDSHRRQPFRYRIPTGALHHLATTSTTGSDIGIWRRHQQIPGPLQYPTRCSAERSQRKPRQGNYIFRFPSLASGFFPPFLDTNIVAMRRAVSLPLPKVVCQPNPTLSPKTRTIQSTLTCSRSFHAVHHLYCIICSAYTIVYM